MTDTQILTLALTLLGIFAASWFNNSRIGDVSLRIVDTQRGLTDRITDLRDVRRAETDVFRAETKAEFGSLRAEMKLGFAELGHRIEKIDDNVARILADHEHRIAKLEEKK